MPEGGRIGMAVWVGGTVTSVQQGWQPATCSYPTGGDWGGSVASHGVDGSDGDGCDCFEGTGTWEPPGSSQGDHSRTPEN